MLKKIKLAVHILRKRPVIYGVKFEKGITLVNARNVRIVDCTFFDGKENSTAITFKEEME